uniref:CCHC-type domain-containing protein n=1 Tax=Tanacetum cinerariifolium TaxID=118510 RepID=A0A699I1G2_TANCI|nr:hypothetical protein [Tanacetum cinerariifolium]
MRIEQYFLMTDYLLWEGILNGDSHVPTRIIDGVFQPIAPTTAEQRLARKNKLKAREAIEKRTHTLIWRNKTDLEEQSLDNLFNSLKIYEDEVKSSSSTSTTTQNIAFVSSSNTDSTNEPVSVASSVSVIDADDLEEMDLKWQMDMLTVECYNCHRKGHFAKECRSPKDTRMNGAAEPQRRNVPAEEEPTNYALMAFLSSSSSSDNEARLLVYQQNKSVFEKDIKLLKLNVQLRDNTLVSLRQNLDKAEQDRDDLKLKLEKFQTSFKNLTELLASQTNAKTCLGYNSQVFTRAMFACDDYLSSGSDDSLPSSLIYDRYKSGNGYHAVPPPYTGTFMPPKPNLVFNNAPNDVKTDHPAFNVKLSPTKPEQDLSYTFRPSVLIIKDWVSDSEDESETKPLQNVPSFVHPTEQSKPIPITAVRPVSTAVPKISVTRPRQAKPVVTKTNSPPRRHITRSPSPKASNSPSRVTAVKAPMVNAAQVVQGK